MKRLRIFLPIILVFTIGCSYVKTYPPELDNIPESSISSWSGQSVAILIIDQRVNREKSQEIVNALYSSISRSIGNGSVHSVQTQQDAVRLGADILLTVKINVYEANFTPGYWHGITNFDVQVFNLSQKDVGMQTFNIAKKVDLFNWWGYKTAEKALKQSFQQTIDDMLVQLKDIANSAKQERLAATLSESDISPIPVDVDVDKNIPRTSVSNRDAIAVVIGNQQYQRAGVPPVDFAVRDATVLKQYLMDTLGYKEGNIMFELNATKARFEAIFGTATEHRGQLYNYVKPDKSDLFIYYSGHGAPDPESKQGYLVPVDCDPAVVKLNGYSISTFYNNLSKIPARSFTVVLDACFSGDSQGGQLLKNISPVFITVDNPLITLPNATLFTSATSEQVSCWYPDKKHSLFTYLFLKGLGGEADADDDRKVTIFELEQFLTDKTEGVPYYARRLHSREQTPVVSGDKSRVIVQFK